MTLTEFLLARIAEEQRLAITAHWGDCDMFSWDLRCTCDLPARVLAECTAKRRIIEIHRFDEGDSDPCDAHGPDYRSIDCDTLLLLAAPYSSHPDFDAGWGTP